ncbi:hypothetical protein CSOJ01_12894 [Colletotrichum sojae]|uniref:Uncharacterized protein n=1 Tax=Colletotrichum sojae TaxID=2175907 RepID=A0A8H6MM14_9PEZI|nr:hypothetical protein CSOJ01_12894 [Colletotrichum sojae]
MVVAFGRRLAVASAKVDSHQVETHSRRVVAAEGLPRPEMRVDGWASRIPSPPKPQPPLTILNGAKGTSLIRTAVNAGDQAREEFLSSTSASADVGLIPASLCTDGNGFSQARRNRAGCRPDPGRGPTDVIAVDRHGRQPASQRGKGATVFRHDHHHDTSKRASKQTTGHGKLWELAREGPDQTRHARLSDPT